VQKENDSEKEEKGKEHRKGRKRKRKRLLTDVAIYLLLWDFIVENEREIWGRIVASFH